MQIVQGIQQRKINRNRATLGGKIMTDHEKLDQIRLAVSKSLNGNLAELERQQAIKLIEEMRKKL